MNGLNFKENNYKTNYDWYIKSHPSEDKTTKEVVDNFVKTTPQVKNIESHLKFCIQNRKN